MPHQNGLNSLVSLEFFARVHRQLLPYPLHLVRLQLLAQKLFHKFLRRLHVAQVDLQERCLNQLSLGVALGQVAVLPPLDRQRHALLARRSQGSQRGRRHSRQAQLATLLHGKLFFIQDGFVRVSAEKRHLTSVLVYVEVIHVRRSPSSSLDLQLFSFSILQDVPFPLLPLHLLRLSLPKLLLLLLLRNRNHLLDDGRRNIRLSPLQHAQLRGGRAESARSPRANTWLIPDTTWHSSGSSLRDAKWEHAYAGHHPVHTRHHSHTLHHAHHCLPDIQENNRYGPPCEPVKVSILIAFLT